VQPLIAKERIDKVILELKYQYADFIAGKENTDIIYQALICLRDDCKDAKELMEEDRQLMEEYNERNPDAKL
jgi:hypothetical protein